MKQPFENPILEVIFPEEADVITTSTGDAGYFDNNRLFGNLFDEGSFGE